MVAIWEITILEKEAPHLYNFYVHASPEFDSKYDSKHMGVPVSIYSHLPNGSEALAIQGREAFNTEKIVLLGFSTQIDVDNEIYTITISDIAGAKIKEATVFLKDNLTGTLVDLNQTNYSFTSGKGTFNGRFTLQFNHEEELGGTDTALQTITLFPNPTASKINIISPNSVVTEIEIVDVLGRAVLSKNHIHNNSVVIDIENLQSASYFIKMKTNSATVIKQIIKE